MLAWKQPFIQRVRNSSLVERSCAENNRASSLSPKLWFPGIYVWRGRGAFQLRRSRSVRNGGAVGKENVGMSNDNPGEKPGRRKTKGSLIDANQIRVSRVLRCTREGKPMANRLIFRYLSLLRWGDEEAIGLRTDGIVR
jgi:hypothetical protein